MGILFTIIAVIVFWFLGLINFGSQETEPVEEEVNNTAEFGDSFLDTNDIGSNDLGSNDIGSNDVLNDTNPSDKDKSNASSDLDEFYKSAVTAKDVDEVANPVGETSTFSTSDDRFYVILTLDPGLPEGTEIAVEWYQDDTLLSEFSTDSEAGQTRVYFFQTSPGVVDDYAAVLSVDGVIVDEVQFEVI